MSAIWNDDGSGWKLLAPAGFPAQAALHDLVEQARTQFVAEKLDP